MTRDEFTDTVASMTPRQREAMAALAGAHVMLAYNPERSLSEWLDVVLARPEALHFMTDDAYPNAIPERPRE